MWNPISDDGAMADFWPPRPNGFWRKALSPLRKFYLKKFYAISDVQFEGAENLSIISDTDGVLLTPNHSHDSDPHVMMALARHLQKQFYFMAAWQIFKGHKGIDGFVLQRMGAFSVDREGCDRRAIRQAIELMTRGKWLVVFPEGEVYRTNDRLTPLREGVAFMATTAAKDLPKDAGQKIWIVPTSIRYRYLEDVTPKLHAAMDKLEAHANLKPTSSTPLPNRVIRFGEAMLAVKEKQHLGQSSADAQLATRLGNLTKHILDRLEDQWLKKPLAGESVSLRVKCLRQHLLATWLDPKAPAAQREAAQAALADVQLVMQLYSYPGDYVLENPTVERLAETVEKLEEDLYGDLVRPKGKRSARVTLGQPIDVAARIKGLRPRTAATKLTETLQDRISSLMLS